MQKFAQFYESNVPYSDTLHPLFWDDFVFNKKVSKAIEHIVKDFLKGDPHVKPEIIEDIQLTGSIANYNFSDQSDLDVHILLDFADINEDEALVKRALDAKRFVWNLQHNIELEGHEVELYFQDIHEPHTASGLYSLQNGTWIKKPVHGRHEVDEKDVQGKADYFIREIQMLQTASQKAKSEKEFQTVNQRAKRLKEKIGKMRKAGLSKSGEFSIENLAFKLLRNEDYIATLNELIIQSYDAMFEHSVDSSREGITAWLANEYSAL